MGKPEFAQQLIALGYQVEDLSDDKLCFNYRVPGGKFIDQELKLGFQVPPDFPLTPPSGPHISPRILPLNPNAPNHPARVAESVFGGEWEYWSRPFPNWATTDRTGKDYMRYIRHLFETQ